MLEADSLSQVVNRCVYPLVAEEFRPQFQALTERVFRGGSGTLEFQILGCKGTRRWLETHASPLRDESGQVVALLGVTRDITERKQAFEALREAYGRLQALSREVRIAEERERSRLSRELRDEFGQLLSALKFDLNRLANGFAKKPALTAAALRKTLTAATATVDRLFASLREMIRGLRPAVLEELGLVPAIEALAAEVQDRSGLCSRVLTDGTDLATSVGPELEGTLYRIEQELLTNVVRHAKATAATIMLSSSDGWVRLVVQDNGRGFNIGVLPPKAQFGLRGVRERAELLGGRIEFQSEPGKGTIVTVSLPITPASLRKDSEVSPQSPTSVAGRKRRRHGK